MNMHVEPVSDASPYLIGEKPAHAKNKFHAGEIVEMHGIVAVVLPCAGKRGEKFSRFMHSQEINGEYRSRFFFSPKYDNRSIEQLNGVTPTLKLEESGCHLHALLTTTDAGEVIRGFVDLPSFEATLTAWYETLRSIPAGSLDVLRNVLDGSAASERLLAAHEKAPE